MPKSKILSKHSRRAVATPKQVSIVERDFVRDSLIGVARTLHDAMIMSITCENALFHMNGEEDTDIAGILRKHSSGKVYGAIVQIAVLSAKLDGKKDVDPEGCQEVDDFFLASRIVTIPKGSCHVVDKYWCDAT